MKRILKTALLFLLLSSLKSFANPEYSFPFKLIDNKIVLNFEIDNVKCLLLYDTGASGINLDSTFVSNNKINLKDILRKGITYRSNEFSKTVNYSDVRDWYKYSGDVCQGILGGSFFEDYIIEIDYKNQLINLYNQDYKIDSDYQRLSTHHLLKDLNFYKYFTTPLTLKLANDKIIIGDFLIDTGSSRNITLINQKVKSKGESFNIVKTTTYNASAHGFNKPEYFQCPVIEFNNINYENLIIDNNTDIKKSNGLSKFIGIIGGDFLKNFKILIDYRNSNVYIKEYIQLQGLDQVFITDGFQLKDFRLYNSKIVVASIVNNELFKDIDIKLNDEILKINGVDISLIDFESIKKLKESVGIKMKYTIKRKRKIIEIETIVQKVI